MFQTLAKLDMLFFIELWANGAFYYSYLAKLNLGVLFHKTNWNNLIKEEVIQIFFLPSILFPFLSSCLPSILGLNQSLRWSASLLWMDSCLGMAWLTSVDLYSCCCRLRGLKPSFAYHKGPFIKETVIPFAQSKELKFAFLFLVQ